LAQVYEARTNLPAATDALAARGGAGARSGRARPRYRCPREIADSGRQIEPGAGLLKEAIAAMPTGETTGAIQLDWRRRCSIRACMKNPPPNFSIYLEAFADPAGRR
jgi:hypothetical protein